MQLSNYRIDNTFVEHSCCWDSAIVADCANGEGQYGRTVKLVCECHSELASTILFALQSMEIDHGN